MYSNRGKWNSCSRIKDDEEFFETVLRLKKEKVDDFSPTFMLDTVRIGSLMRVKWVWENVRGSRGQDYYMPFVVEKGDMDIFEFFMSQKIPITALCSYQAAANGRYEMLRVFLENRLIPIDTRCIEVASKNGHTKVVELLESYLNGPVQPFGNLH